MFRKILVANRGEIAVRVIRACHEMGIPAVAVHSDVDRAARHVLLADEAQAIGPAPASDSYLNIERILDAAAKSGAAAVHPGYGFLSENADFAEACADAGLKFIGPPAEAIRALGVKTTARKMMADAGVPVVPGSDGAIAGKAEALTTAVTIGFPVMLKAAAGGGGKGMRLVTDAESFAEAWEGACGEAAAAFGDGTMYLEKAIVRPRHIEVQVLADEYGQTMHLGERECSLQRRHQKVLEEAPSPFVESHPELRDALCTAAVKAAKAAGYTNAGTVEFLMDQNGSFYFLEMNTRLQVEHPVTELVTGVDLVQQQIAIAAGERLTIRPEAAEFRGNALECRIYAEDPEAGFMPSPGRISHIRWPDGPGIRVDSGADAGWTVPVDYDALIAKLCVWAPTREAAVNRLRRALRETTVEGIATTLGFFRELVNDSRFQAGDFSTSFLTDGLEPAAKEAGRPAAEAVVAAIAATATARSDAKRPVQKPANASRWKQSARALSVGTPGG